MSKGKMNDFQIIESSLEKSAETAINEVLGISNGEKVLIITNPKKDVFEINYQISDLDESSDPKYYGHLSNEGSWLIIEFNESAGTLRYIEGDSDYTTNWTNRAALTYSYYNQLFS